MRLAGRRQEGARLGRWFIALCALVLALCVAHQLLMASERHVAVMGPGSTLAPLGMAMHEGAALVQESTPEMPVPLVGDCPAAQVIVPALLVLVLLLGAALGFGGWPILPAARPRAPGRVLALSPLPVRRQAVLQVFRI